VFPLGFVHLGGNEKLQNCVVFFVSLYCTYVLSSEHERVAETQMREGRENLSQEQRVGRWHMIDGL